MPASTPPKTTSVWPMIAVFLVVATLAILHQAYFVGVLTLSVSIDLTMGYLLLLLGVAKLPSLSCFATTFRKYDLLSKRLSAYPYLYPFIELLLGVLFVSGLAGIFSNLFTGVILLINTLGVVNSLLKKEGLECACLNWLTSRLGVRVPLSALTLAENLSMVFMSSFNVMQLLGFTITVSLIPTLFFLTLLGLSYLYPDKALYIIGQFETQPPHCEEGADRAIQEVEAKPFLGWLFGTSASCCANKKTAPTSGAAIAIQEKPTI